MQKNHAPHRIQDAKILHSCKSDFTSVVHSPIILMQVKDVQSQKQKPNTESLVVAHFHLNLPIKCFAAALLRAAFDLKSSKVQPCETI